MMITVHHERTVLETFKLVDLDVFFMGQQLMVKVPSNFSEGQAGHLQRRANDVLTEMFKDHLNGK